MDHSITQTFNIIFIRQGCPLSRRYALHHGSRLSWEADYILLEEAGATISQAPVAAFKQCAMLYQASV
jgi:hypothetical protein